MKKTLSTCTALVLIDIQQGFLESLWGVRNNPQAEEQMAALLTAWRNAKQPIIHVQHLSQHTESPLHPSRLGCLFQEFAAPRAGEMIIQKQVNSAFIGTQLQNYLSQQQIGRIVLIGLTTDHCVATTARMAGNFGIETDVIADATATFDRTGPQGEYYTAQTMHDTALASLHREFATVTTTAEILTMLIR